MEWDDMGVICSYQQQAGTIHGLHICIHNLLLHLHYNWSMLVRTYVLAYTTYIYLSNAASHHLHLTASQEQPKQGHLLKARCSSGFTPENFRQNFGKNKRVIRRAGNKHPNSVSGNSRRDIFDIFASSLCSLL